MRVTQLEHDRCCSAYQRIRERVERGELTRQEADRDLYTLDTIVAAYALDQPVAARLWRRARELTSSRPPHKPG